MSQFLNLDRALDQIEPMLSDLSADICPGQRDFNIRQRRTLVRKLRNPQAFVPKVHRPLSHLLVIANFLLQKTTKTASRQTHANSRPRTESGRFAKSEVPITSADSQQLDAAKSEVPITSADSQQLDAAKSEVPITSADSQQLDAAKPSKKRKLK